MMKKRQWVEVSVQSPSSYQDLLIGQLATMGFEGFLQENDAFSCYLPIGLWKKGTKERLQTLIDNFSKEFEGLHFPWTTKTIEEKNWNEVWEKSVGIVEATPRIIIKPSWKKLRKKDKGKIVLHIDPKMAFGTGHHETTRLSLLLLEEYLRSGSKVLDFGTGTGILAIAAGKLGAGSASAVDNDPWAVENAVENIARNRVSRRVRTMQGDVHRLPKGPYKLIIADIDLPTITASLKYLVERLKPRGTMIVSGLLTSDLASFMDVISHQGIVPLEMVSENEWVAVALTKADAYSDN